MLSIKPLDTGDTSQKLPSITARITNPIARSSVTDREIPPHSQQPTLSQKKLTISTRYGHFEWPVLPFGLANGPGGFQKRINRVLPQFIDKFVIVYMDDILIYSHTLEEHVEHLKKVLAALSEADLILNIKKCRFFETETRFLGHILTHNSTRPDPRSIEKIINWPTPPHDYRCTWFQQPCKSLSTLYRQVCKNCAPIDAPAERIPGERNSNSMHQEGAGSFSGAKESSYVGACTLSP